MPEETFVRSVMKSFRMFLTILPMLLAVILSVGLFDVLVSHEMLASVFQGNMFYDTLIGTLAGGVSVGQPVASYIIGGELLESGVSLYAIVALLVSWVTLGLVQLPLEQALFGRRFTIWRNLLGLIFAMLVAMASVEIIKVFS
ncbi:MAG: permease [Campylobacterota bacterium]|nr:permease [Campylobacterota bacterium]